jgi:hypothetical protein
MLYENKFCQQFSKSAIFADKANLDSPKQILSAIQQICFSSAIVSAILSCTQILLWTSAA